MCARAGQGQVWSAACVFESMSSSSVILPRFPSFLVEHNFVAPFVPFC